MLNSSPPSVLRNNWVPIVTVFISVLVLFSSVMIYYTWHIGTPWGSFSDHWPVIRQSAVAILFHGNMERWLHYWAGVVSYELEFHFYGHLALPILLAIFPAWYASSLFYYPGGRDHLVHVSGPRLYFYKVAHKHAASQVKKESRENPSLGLNIHPNIAISRARESGNIFVGGAQGTGKSIFINHLAAQVLERGQRAFIYDEKREYTARFYDKKTCILIAPWDTRGVSWDISRDAKNETQAQLIAEHFIAESKDPLWSNGARIIFVGFIMILNKTRPAWGWRELAKMLVIDEAKLVKSLGVHYPLAAKFIKENSQTTQGFFVQLLGHLGWVNTLALAWPKPTADSFSVERWVSDSKSSKRTIIIQADKRYKNIGAPLASVVISLMTSHVLAREDTKGNEYWLFLDELANLPRNESLYDWMSLGRSKGCRIVAGIQSIHHLKKIYSDHGADALLSMFTIFASMRIGSAGATANYTAKVFGEREVERPSHSFSSRGEVATSWHKEVLPLVRSTDLVHLPHAGYLGVEGYLLVPGWDAVYRLRWPVCRISKDASPHLPAKWLRAELCEDVTSALSKDSIRKKLQRKRDALNK